MNHTKLIAAASIGMLAIVGFGMIQTDRADSRKRYEMELASRPSDWKRGITGITFENLEGRPEFETVVVSENSSATKIVGNLRSVFFDDEYLMTTPESRSGFQQESSWRLRIDNELKGNIYWEIDVMDHAESGKKMLRIQYSSNGSLRFCGLPSRGPWRGWLLD